MSIGFWGGLGELAEVVALAEAGRLRTSVQRFRLSRVAEACPVGLGALLAGQGAPVSVTSGP